MYEGRLALAVADQDDLAGEGGLVDAGQEGFGCAAALHANVETVTVRDLLVQVLQCLGILAVGHAVRAHLGRFFQAAVQQVGHVDLGADGLGAEHRKHTDRTCADDEDFIALLHITAGDAVVADAERLYQRQLACGQTFAGEDTLNRHRDVLLEGAVALDAHRLVVRTAVYETATAGVALAAVEVGVAGDDITQGLPRVEELFEARKPKKMGQLAEISGRVSIDTTQRAAYRTVTITADDGEVKQYQIAHNMGLKVSDGSMVKRGDRLTDGSLSPHDVLRISGLEAVQNYLIQEVQAVYRQQGVDINDKHIEIIVRQMMRKVKIEDAGDTDLLTGSVVDVQEYEDANAAVQKRIDAGEEGLQLATRSLVLMGITKASLATESFLSAASFQETTKVLTDAAIKGKIDPLEGLKENVIIGKLIPAGSGMQVYRDYNLVTTPESPVTQDMIENEKF